MVEHAHQRSNAADRHERMRIAPSDEIMRDVRATIELHPFANPMPLGFVGLSMATLALAAVNLSWIGPAQDHAVAIALLAFVVPLQGIACLGGLASRDAVAGTAMGILAATWAVAGFVLLGAAPGSTSAGLGVVFEIAAIALALPALAALASKLVVAAILIGAMLRIASSGVYQLTGSDAWKATTGWIGVVLGALALYAALAMLLESTLTRTILPLGRRGRGRRAVEGSLSDQLVSVANEPGVRQQL